MPRPPALSQRPSVGRRCGSLLVAVIAAAALCGAQPALASARSGLVVVPHPSARLGLSYFKLGVIPGQTVRAGAIELRNLSTSVLRVALTAVNGQTLSTLGSGYAAPAAKPRGSTSWLRVARRLVILAPGRSTSVPVWVRAPRGAASGDYLSGVSIEALDQGAQSSPHKGISIASVERYVIGVESSVAGPRHPLIRITGVELQREPSGLTLLLRASNLGNVILQHTFGRALVTYGHLTVTEMGLGPGTFVTGTSIAYPLATLHRQPRQGSVYRVRAYLLYPGGSARVDTYVRVGRAVASPPQLHKGLVAVQAHKSSGPSAKVLALAGVLIALLLLGLVVVLLRRRRKLERSAAEVLGAALLAGYGSGEPVGLIAVGLVAGASATGTPATSELVAVLRSRLRQADELCALPGGGFLVVAADTDVDTTQALAADLRRHLGRLGADANVVTPGG